MSDLVERLHRADQDYMISDPELEELCDEAAEEISRLTRSNWMLSDCLKMATDKDLALKVQSVVELAREIVATIHPGQLYIIDRLAAAVREIDTHEKSLQELNDILWQKHSENISKAAMRWDWRKDDTEKKDDR